MESRLSWSGNNITGSAPATLTVDMELESVEVREEKRAETEVVGV